MNPIAMMDGIQTYYSNRVGQVKFLNETDFRRFVIRIRNFGVQVMHTWTFTTLTLNIICFVLNCN